MSDFEKRVEILLQQSLLLKPEDRNAFVEESCAGEPELRDRVLALIEAHEAKESGGETSLEEQSVSDYRVPRMSSSEEKAGDQIGRYRLVELIGEGAWGSVWKAVQTADIEREVALKILKLGLDTKDFLARFEAERQILAMMEHPNIAMVLDAGATDYGRPFLVMELVRGQPLMDYVDESRLNLRERIELFIPICQALDHAHRRGIIHRDIKPSNILVTEKGGKAIPKVIDFGIAKSNQRELPGTTHFTRLHTFMGTPLYCSPEQVEPNGHEVDQRSDIYSLGAVLFQLLSGVVAFQDEQILGRGLDTLRAIIREKEPPLVSASFRSLDPEKQADFSSRRGTSASKLEAQLKGDLDWILLQCMEKDPALRYATAAELAGDLQAHLQNDPVSAAAPSVVYRTRKFFHRQRKKRNSWALIPAAVLCIIGLAFFFQARNERQADQQLQELNPHSLAILPLGDLSEAENDELFAFSMHSELLAAISQIPELQVASRLATLPYQDSGKSRKQIARDLGVAKLVTGDVKRVDDRIRLSIQLIELSSGDVLWKDEHLREFSEDRFFEVQKKLASDVAEAMKAVLFHQAGADQDVIPTQSMKALQAYLKGKEILDTAQIERAWEAIEFFEAAVEIDPDFALAYAGLAECYSFNGSNVGRDLSFEERMEVIQNYIDKALAIDDSLPEVHVLIGAMKVRQRDKEGARVSFERAIELDPDFADAHYHLGRMIDVPLYRDPNRFFALNRRLEHVRKAVELEPAIAQYREFLANVLLNLGEKQEALVHLRTMVELSPESAIVYYSAGTKVLEVGNRYDEAITLLRKGYSLAPQDHRFQGPLKKAYEALGDWDSTVFWIEKIIDSEPQLGPLYRADLARHRGDTEEAMRIYRQNLARSMNYTNARLRVLREDLRLGNYEEAKQRYYAAVRNRFSNPRLTEHGATLAVELAVILLAAGETDEGQRLVDLCWDHFKRHADTRKRDFYEALVLTMKGDQEGALRVLTRFVENGARAKVDFNDPGFDSLRDHPEFIALMDIVEADLEEQLANVRRMEANGELAPLPDL